VQLRDQCRKNASSRLVHRSPRKALWKVGDLFEDRLETVQPIIRMIGSGLSLGLVLIAGQKALLDDLYNDAASGGWFGYAT
jgi:hypothetical protein